MERKFLCAMISNIEGLIRQVKILIDYIYVGQTLSCPILLRILLKHFERSWEWKGHSWTIKAARYFH